MAWVLVAPLAWLFEAVALIAVAILCLVGPWTNRLIARRRPHERGPVLMVHGQLTTRGSMLLVGLGLRRAGFAPVAVDYRWWATAEDGARVIQQAARALASEHGVERVDVVAHSIGGVFACLARAMDGGEPIGRLVTLGTPHGGASWRRWLAPAGIRPVLAKGTRDKLRPGDLAVVALSDLIVPSDRALIERSVTLPWLGHAGLVVHPASLRAAVAALRATDATP